MTNLGRQARGGVSGQDNRLGALRQRLAAPPASAWRPDLDHPPILAGTVEAINSRHHEHGDYQVVTVVDEAGERWSWHGWGRVAEQQLDDARPEAGDLIAVEYQGERTSAEGRRYRSWRVEVERAPGRRFDDDVRQVPERPILGQDKRHEPFPWPEGEGPGGDAA
jgi:YD repeat-containing protein